MHPIETLLLGYYSDFESLKDEHSDLSNMDFHKLYGLSVSCPTSWPLVDGVGKVTCDAVETTNGRVLIIYDTTSNYDMLSKACPDSVLVSYLSWYEIFTALFRNNTDTRALSQIQSRIRDASVVFFFCGVDGALPDVLNWVRNFCSSCLIVLGQSQEK